MIMSRRQGARLAGLALGFWIVAVFALRLDPAAVGPGWRGNLGFLTSLPGAWLCVTLARRLAGLDARQLVAATALVVGIDTLLDAAALRWAPSVYGGDADQRMLAGAWLLWGYGASLAAAFAMTRGHGRLA